MSARNHHRNAKENPLLPLNIAARNHTFTLQPCSLVNSRLQHLFDVIELDRKSMSDAISALPLEKFNKSVGGKWSIEQILAHLITGERLSLLYLRKKINGIDDLANSGIREEIVMTLLRISQRLPFRFVAPAVVVKLTPNYATVAALLDDWHRERNALKTFLEQIKDEQLKRLVYKHPRTGYMNVQHGLMFFHEHFVHHLPQITRLLNS